MKILIIGGGTMGITYAMSFLRSHVIHKADLMILEKSKDKLPGIMELGFTQVYDRYDQCVHQADLIILAVKPLDTHQLFDIIRTNHPVKDKLVLSIMAGIKIKTIKNGLDTQRIVRAMPNLPAQVSEGMTVFTATPETSRKDLLFVQNLINTTGKSLYVEAEDMIDAATAISGSGPAYVFEFMKIITRTGQELGFTESESELLTLQTFKGAIDIFTKSDLSFDQWINLVASKGGTTEAALNQFNQDHLQKIIRSGIMAANDRAIRLGNTN